MKRLLFLMMTLVFMASCASTPKTSTKEDLRNDQNEDYQSKANGQYWQQWNDRFNIR